MYWQISKLVLTMWRNRLHQLFRNAPYLWFIVALMLVCYIGGSYLAHDFFYQALQPFTTGGYKYLPLKPIIISAFFCSFGLSAFSLLIAALLFTPDDTVLKRIFSPLPVSASEQRFGTLLPGIILLFVAQLLLWTPTLPVFIQLDMAQWFPLILTTLFGLLCYNAATLAFYQGILYITTLLFGADRAGIRNTAMGLTMAIGLVLLMIPLIYGAQALTTGKPGWLTFVPSYWMVLVLDPRPLTMLAGLGLLLATTLLCLGLYVFFIERCEKLTLGTKGHWAPLRRLPFPRSFFLSSIIYEVKNISRDEQIVIGFVMTVGIWLAATGVIFWIRDSNPLLSYGLVEVTTNFITIMLCAIAQMSWGRDRSAYRVLASTPLHNRQFINGKLGANFLVITVCWLLLIGSMSWISNDPMLVPNLLPLLLLGCLFCFCLGIALPYSTENSLSMLPAVGVVTILALPAYMFAQAAQKVLAQVPGGTLAQIFVQYIAILVLLGAFYVIIHKLNQLKMENAL